MFTATVRKTVTLTLAVGLAVFGLVACEDTTGGDSGTMSLELTDAPAGDISQAWVDIGTIALQGEGGETVLVDDPQGPDNGFFELTSLAGTTEELVSDAVVSAGTYTQLRIVIDAGAVETDDGDVFSFGGAADALGLSRTGALQDASTAQTGIKVNLPEGGVTIEDDQKIVLLDFDVSESFGREAGMSDQWVFMPLIRTSEIGFTGSVAGNVDDSQVSWPTCGGVQTSVEDFVPHLLDNGDVAYTGDVGPQGDYEIQFVEPATYGTGFADEVTFEGDVLTISANASTPDVTVEEDATSTVDYTVTGVSCSGSSG